MAISLVASASANSTNLTDVTSLVISKPTGTASGDFMIAIVTAHSTASITASGWTQVASEVDSTGTKLKTWFLTKTAGGSEPTTYTFSWSGGASAVGGIITYRGSNGLATVGLGNQPQSLNTLADPATEPGTYDITQPYMAGYALTWHDNRSGGSPAVTATGSTGTELWDRSTIDGSPSTHERGMAAYSKTGIGAELSSSFGATVNPTQTIDGCVAWSWSVCERPYVVGAATIGALGASGTGTAASNPSGAGAATIGALTASGQGAMQPKATGSATIGAFAAAGAGYEHPTVVGACTIGSMNASGVAGISGTFFEMFIDGAWTDYTEYIQNDPGVFIQRGRTDANGTAAAQYASFQLLDVDNPLRFIPTNPSSPLYGKFRKNTKVRITRQESGVRFVGEVSTFDFIKGEAGAFVGVNVQAFGILHRLESGEAVEKSALFRETLALASTWDLIDYWPCEEEDGAVRFDNYCPQYEIYGGLSPKRPPLRITNLGENGTELGHYDGLKCSKNIPQVGDAKWRSVQYFGNPTTGSGKTFSFLIASPGGITNGTEMFRVSGRKVDGSETFLALEYTGTDTWQLNYNNTALVTSLNIPIVGKSGVMFYISFAGNLMRLWSQQTDEVLPTGYTAISDSGPSDWGNYSITVNNGGVALNEASSAYIGHIAVWDTSDVVGAATTMPVFASLDAYLGENAATRFGRLCEEEGVTYEIYGTIETSSKRMGYQTPGTFLDLLRQCEATDKGIMYELREDFGLGYRPVSTLYNQTTTATVDWAAGEFLEQGFTPRYDDADNVNSMTVTREGGATATYTDTVSVDTIGEYASSASLSLYQDENAYAHAGWAVHLGRQEEIRIASISFAQNSPALLANNTLKLAVQDLDMGQKMTLTNPPEWLRPSGDVEQIVVGYTEQWDSYQYTWSFTTSPAEPYNNTGLAGTSKVGLNPATLFDGIDSTDTSFFVVVESPNYDSIPPFSAVNSGGGFDIIVNGEQMTVTSVSWVGGGSIVYTFNVTRSVNGVVRSHSAGDLVRMANRPIVAL